MIGWLNTWEVTANQASKRIYIVITLSITAPLSYAACAKEYQNWRGQLLKYAKI